LLGSGAQKHFGCKQQSVALKRFLVKPECSRIGIFAAIPHKPLWQRDCIKKRRAFVPAHLPHRPPLGGRQQDD
jgi:hypothetical protein